MPTSIASCPPKFFIDEPPDSGAAIRINRFADEQGKACEDLPQFLDEGLQA